jgi:23S rRNA pseudouridine1911/1915/1917 synthase
VYMEEELKDSPDQSELFEHFRYVVDPGQGLLRIDKYLSARIENASRTRVQTAAAAGNILVNEQPVKSNYKVKPGDVITIVMAYPPRELEIIPEDIPLNIVYEDDDVVVVNKTAGMVVHPGHGNYTGTLINALAYRFKDLPLYQAGELRPGLVHRLDKDTSGILVVAKTEFALNRLAKQFYDRTTSRKYIALVWGNLKEEEGTITGNIGRDPRDRMKMTVFTEGDEGKPAITHYRLEERFSYVNLVECILETGRTHQIRAHFEYLGHPLFNDDRYGGNLILKGTTFSKYRQFVENCFKICPRHALHAKSLGFKHPVTQQEMFFDSELPEDMQFLIEKWRRYIAGRESDII